MTFLPARTLMRGIQGGEKVVGRVDEKVGEGWIDLGERMC